MTELTDKPIDVMSPLGDGVLKFLRMTASEELGRLFEFQLHVLSQKKDVAAEDLLGQPMTVLLATRNDSTRYFHGYVTEFARVETSERSATYRVVLRPKLWFLTQASDCRIFQGEVVPDIVKTILSEHGVSDIEDRLNGEYRTWEYCVQYRETDFDFISRLMEQEGMYYYFKHEDSRNIMVLADSLSAHDTVPEYESIRLLDEATTSLRSDHITSWNQVKQIRPGKVVLNDYDFKNPKTKLIGQVSDPKPHAEASHEIFDYPGEYLTKAEGDVYAKIRLEELHAGFEVSHGAGYARGLGVGALFTLTDHPVEAQNAEYLITRATHELKQEEYEAGAAAPQVAYVGNLSAIFSKQPYRSPRTTPKPIVQGPQTAIVAGQGGPVYTDEYGRVKVQFHWDRHGGSDENSSCWIRVAQLWAGKNWGGMHIPEIGQEVIVEFLEGDPDRPIITGRVYNQDNMPPLPLPADNLKSIIRDHYGNQIVFDATPGDEHIQIFSPHHNSMVEIGKSVAWKSQDPAFMTSDADYFSFTAGVTGSAYVGAKLGITVGFDSTITLGMSVGILLGGKYEWAKGTQSAIFKGNKHEIASGYKVAVSHAQELRLADEGFAFRSMKHIVLDSALKTTINSGSKDNSLLNMDDNEICIDYGSDGAASNKGAETDAAAYAQEAIAKTLLAYGAVTAAGVGGASLMGGGIFDMARNGVSLTDRSLYETIFGATAGLVGGAAAIKYAAAAKQASAFGDVYKADIGGAKVEQDDTFARVKLFKDGIKIQTFEAGGKPKDESDTAEVFIKKTGEILITSKKVGMTIHSEKPLTIVGKDTVTFDVVGLFKVEAANIELKAKGGKVTANPKIENAGG